jgi:prophage regulatory protein
MSEKFDVEQTPVNALDRFLSRKHIMAITGLSSATLWREVKAGRFPAPVEASPQRKCWSESEIRGWQVALLAARRSTLH